MEIEHILQQIMGLLRRGQIALFLGPDLPESLSGGPSWSDLADGLAGRGYPAGNDWPSAATRFAQTSTRRDLIDWLDDQLSDLKPGPFYGELLDLPVTTYLSTTYHNLLQSALEATGRKANIVIEEPDLNFIRPERPTIVKLLGEASPGRRDSLSMTNRDLQNLGQYKANILAQEVFPIFTSKSLLIFGQDVNAEFFKDLYYRSLPQNDVLRRRAFAIWPGLESWQKENLGDDRLTVIEADPLEFVRELIRQLDIGEVLPPKKTDSEPVQTQPIRFKGVGPMKILFLAANPVETQRLRLDEEVREIDSRLRRAEFRDRFEIVSHWAVRHTDLVELLLRHKPHIVHFSGHGSESGEIILEEEMGESHPVSPQVLRKLFKVLKDNVQCVFLNACWTANQADAIAKEIACVVGMSRSISDDAAIDFASGFYQALGFGRNVQDAFDLGTIEIDLANIPESATPNLITKAGVSASDVTFE